MWQGKEHFQDELPQQSIHPRDWNDNWYCTVCKSLVCTHEEVHLPSCQCTIDVWPYVEAHGVDGFPAKWIAVYLRFGEASL